MITIAQIKNTLKALLDYSEQATPRPWEASKTSYGIPAVFRKDHGQALAMLGVYKKDMPCPVPNYKENRAFIVHACNLTPIMCRMLLMHIDALEFESQETGNLGILTRRAVGAQARLDAMRRDWPEDGILYFEEKTNEPSASKDPT